MRKLILALGLTIISMGLFASPNRGNSKEMASVVVEYKVHYFDTTVTKIDTVDLNVPYSEKEKYPTKFVPYLTSSNGSNFLLVYCLYIAETTAQLEIVDYQVVKRK